MANREQHGIRLLSLDGGGIRGVSELVILEEIMNRVRKMQNLPETEPALPCDYFDLIGGTSTGGLIAILLGRLRLSVPEALEQYSILAKTVFSERKWKWEDGWFKASKLELAIKSVLNWKLGPGHDHEGMWESGRTSLCRVFVCAMPGRNMTRPRLFRTYRVERNEGDNCTIWEAGRATSAAPMFFKRIKIGRPGMEEEFVDAALGCNNPTKQLMAEAEAVFGDSRDVACIVSIGTGKPKVTGFKTPLLWQRIVPLDLIEALKKIATSSDSTAEQMAEKYKYFKRLYYRLNVDQGLEDIRLEEWETLGEVTTHTKTYLDRSDVSQQIDEIAGALVAKRSPEYMLRQIGVSKPISESHLIYDFPKGVSQFVNRDAPLKQITRLFNEHKDDEGEPTVAVLIGMGGSGKTQLALKYCRRTRLTQRYDSIFWVDASNPNSVSRSFAAIEELIFDTKVDIANVTASVKKVTAKMSRWQTSWLIVFDNFDTPNLFDDEGINFRDYFPSGNRGAILVTSRNEGAGHLATLGNPIDVNKMTEDEGLELLIRVSETESIGGVHRSTGVNIISRLGFLALAIHQAGAYIKARKLTPSLFIEHFNNWKENMLKEIPALWAYTKKLSDAETVTALSVFTTWEMSFSQISNDGGNKIKKEHLLTISAFLDNKHIHAALFYWYFKSSTPGWMDIFATDGSWAGDKFGDVLAELKTLSLLEFLEPAHTDGAYFGMHPLIQDWIKLRMNVNEVQDYVIESLDLLGANTPASFIGFVHMPLQSKQAFAAHLNAARQNNDHYKTKLLEDPKMKDIASNFAHFYREQGLYAEAEELYGVSIAGWKDHAGPEHQETLRMMGNLAIIYSLKGNYPEAEKLFAKLLDSFKAQFGDEHIDTVSAMSNLACVYHEEGRHADAERLRKQALEIKTKTLGQKDPSTLRTASGLASTYRLQGRYDEAEHLYDKVLSKLSRDDWVDSWAAGMDAMHGMAEVYTFQRRYKEAEGLFKGVLKLRGKWFGPEHPTNGRTLVALADLFKDQNRNIEAADLYQRALEVRKNALGSHHPATMRVKDTLESLQRRQK